MKIDLTELLRKIGEEADLTLEEKASYPEDGLSLTQPVKINLHLINTGPSVLLTGSVKTEAELECARCLKKFRQPLKFTISEEYSRVRPQIKPGTGKKELELTDQDFVYPIEKDSTIDIGETIRQNLCLAMPIKPLCRANCQPAGAVL